MYMTDFSPTRVASLQPSITVIFERLGLLDRLVACTKYCVDVAPEVVRSGAHIIQDSWTAKADEILAAKPDLVIASVPYQLAAVAEILKSGIRFIGFAPHSLNDIYADIATLAGVMNVMERGEALIREMQEGIVKAREATRMLPRVSVYAEEWGKPLIHSQTWVAELVEAAGGEFIGVPGAHTDAETVAAANPDVILTAWCGAGNRVPLEKIIRDRNWAELAAVWNRRVFCINDELLNTPAPTLLGGLHAILWALHPEQFPAAPGIRQIAADLSPVRLK
jgi:iron complex transport system substrate-binding protein